MGVTVSRVASVSPAPLVVLYHAGASQAVLDAWPEATIISETHPGFKNWYTHLGADGLVSVPDLISAAGLREEDVSHIVLVGFSEGTQGIRTQMLAGVQPDAVLAVDGIHTKPELWADIIRRARAMEAAATVTHSSIQPGTYKSTTQIAAELVAPDVEQPVDVSSDLSLDDTSLPYKMTSYFQDGYFRVVGYSGSDAPAHQFQGQRVLPAELAIIREELSGVAPQQMHMSQTSSTLLLAGILGVTAFGVWWMLRKK